MRGSAGFAVFLHKSAVLLCNRYTPVYFTSTKHEIETLPILARLYPLSEGRFIDSFTYRGYRCHWSSAPPAELAKRARDKRIIGSKKMGAFCPAEIETQTNIKNGNVEVKLQKTHIGHEVNVEDELKHVSLSASLKNSITTRLQMGVTQSTILLGYQCSHRGSTSDEPLKRRDLIRYNDVANIAKKIEADKIFPSISRNDCVNVQSFLENYKEKILYCKKVGQKVKGLEDEDFVLVYCNPFQCNAWEYQTRRFCAAYATRVR